MSEFSIAACDHGSSNILRVIPLLTIAKCIRNSLLLSFSSMIYIQNENDWLLFYSYSLRNIVYYIILLRGGIVVRKVLLIFDYDDNSNFNIRINKLNKKPNWQSKI